MKYLFGIFLLFFCSIVFCQNITDFEYEIENGNITITKYTGNIKDIVIPQNINGLPVISIGHHAFYSKEITSVIIPSSVTSIDGLAFNSNLLTNIVIPNSVTFIGHWAFCGNNLTIIDIPDSVVTIGEDAFAFNPIASINLPNNVDLLPDSFYLSLSRKYIENGYKKSTFNISYSTYNDFVIAILDNSVVEIIGYNRESSIKDVNIPEKINGLPVVAIGTGAFDGCEITNVVIPNSVVSIGSEAFSYNKLTSVIIPNSVTYIGSFAFNSRNPVEIIRQ